MEAIDIERAMNLGRKLGFVVQISNASHPRLRWLDGEGALSGHGRPATEAEIRLWCLLAGVEYVPWSLGRPSAARDALTRNGVGVPVEGHVAPPAGR